ncbi:hypothetical protein ACXN2V_004409, partial [Escherichia coli]
DKSAVKFNEWKEFFSTTVSDAEIEAEGSPLRFKSITKHPATALPYHVRHMGVSLYHYTGKKTADS